jgi:transcriptional regulator with XRE-family HTH domain
METAYFGSNIKRLRERSKWSQDDLAEKMKITRSKLALLESGNTKNPQVQDLIGFSSIFGISIDTLLKLDLRAFSELKIRELETGNDAYTMGTKIRVLTTTVDVNNNEQIELVSEKAKAGYRSGYNDPDWIAELPRYSLPGLSKHSKYRIFPISGDSMLPYPDGCYIVGEYVEDWTNLKDNTLCILILKNEGADFVFKQIENRINNKKTLLAKSLNPLYQPYEIPISDVIEMWRYKAHLAKTITQQILDVSSEQLLNMMHDIKLNIDNINKRLTG